MLLLLACTSAPKATDSPTESAELQPQASTAWFMGISDGQTPDGSFDAPPQDLLFIRALDPVASTITEEAWADEGREWSYYKLIHQVDVAASTFTSEFVTGDGTLLVVGGYDAGEPWAWTAWHSTSTYQDGQYQGTYVTSEDSLSSEGVATAHKEVFDETSTNTWSIVETLNPVDEATFNNAMAEVTVAP